MAIVAGNWKMALGVGESVELARKIASFASDANYPHTEIWIAPSPPCLGAVSPIVQNTPVKLGAQNAHWELKGAFTGESSVPQLKELGCSFVIVGHSERRHIFGETKGDIAKRAHRALIEGLTPVFCVGETEKEREDGKTALIIAEQLSPFLELIKETSSYANFVVAYEPVWAIGTGKVANVEQIEEAHGVILDLLGEALDKTSIPVLYGGSVKPDNFSEIISIPNVSGALVGGASLDSEKFRKLVEIAEERA
ncbi:MAG: triose-phosphate isomerase [Candidatus Dadabacteria bacterium]|nr:MAG: triose-phosphate isomerase [Candidatus Dadabacteria bacterium]